MSRATGTLRFIIPGWKIRNKKTGLFSTGGSSPGWNETGKTWTSRGGLTNHIVNIAGNKFYGRNEPIYDNCEVIEYELIYNPLSQADVSDYKDEIKRKRLQQEREEQKRKEAAEKEERRKLYLKLRNEFADEDNKPKCICRSLAYIDPRCEAHDNLPGVKDPYMD